MGLFDAIVIYGAVVVAILVASAVVIFNVVAALEERGVRKDRERRRRLAETYSRRPHAPR